MKGGRCSLASDVSSSALLIRAVGQEFRRRAEEAELSDEAEEGLSAAGGHQDAAKERPGAKTDPGR
jgi:hypothetical protein